MLFLYKLAYYTGYFILMIILLVSAILAAKSKGAWLLYGLGAVVQLLVLLGGSKVAAMRGNSMALEWVIYIALLILSAVLITKRYQKAQEGSYKPRPSVIKPNPAPEPPPVQSTSNENKGHEPRFCRNCGGKLLPDSVFCSRCGTKVK